MHVRDSIGNIKWAELSIRIKGIKLVDPLKGCGGRGGAGGAKHGPGVWSAKVFVGEG